MKILIRKTKKIRKKHWRDGLMQATRYVSALGIMVLLVMSTTCYGQALAHKHRAEIIGADGIPVILPEGRSLVQATGRSVEPVDSNALVALYHSAQGAHWNNNSGWLTDMVEFWHGINRISNVGTDENPEWRVTRLSFDDNLLSVPGELPPELAAMDRLDRIRLRHSMLIGGIPPEYKDLNVRRLEIPGHFFSGEAPWEAFAEMPRLERLYIYNNYHVGEIPPIVKDITNLTELWLNNNYFSGVLPGELAELENLNTIRVQGNQVTGIIPDLSPANKLAHIQLCPNPFDEQPFPEWVRNLSETLRRWNNTDWTLRATTMQDHETWEWDVPTMNVDCNFVGEFPQWFDEMTQLEEFALGDRGLTGQIPDLSFNPNLKRLWILGSGVTGEFPDWITRVPNLEWLFLGHSLWTGPLPGAIADLPLTRLELVQTHLEGPIPEELSLLSGLIWLNIDSNKFMEVNEIPSWIGQLENMSLLHLKGMGFTGEIPGAVLGSFDRLDNLNLSNNKLTGSIPPELGTRSALYKVNLSNNQLSGGVPSELQNTPLRILNLSDNPGLEIGPMPQWLADLPGLRSLNLKNTGLTGSIPEWVDQMTLLHSLKLDHNELEGEIPSQLVNFGAHPGVFPTKLHLGHNNLTGDIPDFFGNSNFQGMEEIDLSGNNFTPGPIPGSLIGLDALKVLNLSETNRTGEIPGWLTNSNFPNLRTLALNGNELTGEIPSGLGSFTLLESLNLADNQLTGSLDALVGAGMGIKDDIRAWYTTKSTTMSGLVVSGNEGLTGPVPITFTDWDSRVMRVIWFDDTGLCEPDDTPEFQDWLDAVAELDIDFHYHEDLMTSVRSTGVLCSEVPSSVEDMDGLPRSVHLHNNYPNPFNPATTIKFDLPTETHVTLTVYNLLGQRVSVLVNGQVDAGYHQVQFDASRLASGTYLYRLEAGERSLTQSMMLIK